jgi:hypothetical protein
MFDSLKGALIDSLARAWKLDYLLEGVVMPTFAQFWEPLYLHDGAFLRFAFLQCERERLPADFDQNAFFYFTQYFTISEISGQMWILKAHPDSNFCLRDNLRFVDSIATIVLTDDSLSKYYRRYLAGMDKYADPLRLNGAGFSLRIDSTFKGKRLERRRRTNLDKDRRILHLVIVNCQP